MGIIILLFFFSVVPVLLGELFVRPIKRINKDNFVFVYMIGILVWVAISEILSVPMTSLSAKFSTFVWTYNGILLVLIFLSLILCRKQIMLLLSNTWEVIRNMDKRWWLVLLAVFIPVIYLSFRDLYAYGDDKTYISMVNDILSSNTLYLIDADTGKPMPYVQSKYCLSSYWTWIAYLAKMSGLHPLILCKTVLMFLFVPMSYAVQGLFAEYLFRRDERKVFIYMLLVVLVSIWGGFSNYTVTYRLYTWSWQSKAFLAMIVLPFVLYYLNAVFEDENRTLWDYVLLFIMIIATCSTTLTGTGLVVAMSYVIAGIYSVIHRKKRILVATGFVCFPAYILMILYIKYYDFVFGLHLWGN
ncbi:MAG: DUF6077 domain-containing protein [Agathobacter sp.]